MIHIQITQDESGLELFAAGHAGYAPQGQDIVCAGVSALLYGFVAYLEALPPIATAGEPVSEGDHPHLEVREGDGYLWVCTHGLGGRDTDGFAVTEAGLRLLASAYPACVMLEREYPTPRKERGTNHES